MIRNFLSNWFSFFLWENYVATCLSQLVFKSKNFCQDLLSFPARFSIDFPGGSVQHAKLTVKWIIDGLKCTECRLETRLQIISGIYSVIFRFVHFHLN